MTDHARLTLSMLLCLVAYVAAAMVVGALVFEPSLAADPDAPTRLVYVPRCSPAFAGAALVCVDAPTAKTFSTTEAQ